jgi:hypothetical protein
MRQLFAKKHLWRFGSPSCLLLAALLFPLPWLEVCCHTAKGPAAAVTVKTGAPVAKDAFSRLEDLFNPKAAVLVSQSGWQAATGEYSERLKISNSDEPDPPPRIVIEPARLLFGYFVVVILGAVLGLLLATTWDRRLGIVGMCAATASAFLWIQTAAGFPIADLLEVEKARAREKGRSTAEEYVRFTSWFYMSHLVTLGAIGLLIAERRAIRRENSTASLRRDLRFDIHSEAGYNISETSFAARDSANVQELENQS